MAIVSGFAFTAARQRFNSPAASYLWIIRRRRLGHADDVIH